ncbi:RICIN domain-containing protein [Kibdelosporangium aridum]|uniref:Ricin-type beta-trefoil lectin domain-containing protein n=1 Tax=Kibdelosporangium aridum TaxID=2030 RepID=A0A1Y5YAX6_KIBAR|nr:RICIN domain-containing protein [Kibdelosporangium aridum]SMD26819.1 Ricin-type beta-trefoil lectin domain-containing protein [Kibdelosporangium aridum]
MKLRALFTVLALTGALFTAIGGTASAAVYFQIRAQHSDKCLDVYNASVLDNAPVVQWTCFGSSQANQLWKLVDIGNGLHYKVAALHSNKCLTVPGSAMNDGAAAVQFTCFNPSPANQLWRIERIGGAYYNLVAVHSGKCLDITGGPGSMDDGAAATQWACLGPNQTNQRFRFVSA